MGEQTDTDTAKLVVYFRSFANAPKTCEFPQSENRSSHEPPETGLGFTAAATGLGNVIIILLLREKITIPVGQFLIYCLPANQPNY